MRSTGFYAWQARPESRHAREDRRLNTLVHQSFTDSRRNYGSPRVHDDLKERQERVSRKRIVRLMQEDGLVARVRKRYKHTTLSDHDQPVADTLLAQTFVAAAPNQRWVGDTTEFVIGTSSKLSLAASVDLFSRDVVGWAVSSANGRHRAALGWPQRYTAAPPSDAGRGAPGPPSLSRIVPLTMS